MSPRRPTRCYVCDGVEVSSAGLMCEDCEYRFVEPVLVSVPEYDERDLELTPPTGTAACTCFGLPDGVAMADCPAGHEGGYVPAMQLLACLCHVPGTWCPQHSGSWPP